MTIFVFGATGATGKLVVEQALQNGHYVTAVVRNPDKFTLRHDHLKIIRGDVFQPKTYESDMRGHDAVVSCLGIQQTAPTTVYSDGVDNIMMAMEKENVNRIICLSAIAVVVPPKGSFLMKFMTRNILQRLYNHLYTDMLVMEKKLRASDLNWTIIRPPWLRDTRATGKYRVMINDHLRNPSKISRADLAGYIVNHLADEKTFKAVVQISY